MRKKKRLTKLERLNRKVGKARAALDRPGTVHDKEQAIKNLGAAAGEIVKIKARRKV